MTVRKLENNEEYSYQKGIMGAILGALIIIVPWMLTKRFFGFNASPFAYFLGLAIYKGYRWNKGKTGPKTRVIILFTSIISLIVALGCLMIIELLRDGLKVSMVNIRGVLHGIGGLSSFTFNMILAVILLYLFVKPLYKELKYDVKESDFKI